MLLHSNPLRPTPVITWYYVACSVWCTILIKPVSTAANHILDKPMLNRHAPSDLCLFSLLSGQHRLQGGSAGAMLAGYPYLLPLAAINCNSQTRQASVMAVHACDSTSGKACTWCHAHVATTAGASSCNAGATAPRMASVRPRVLLTAPVAGASVRRSRSRSDARSLGVEGLQVLHLLLGADEQRHALVHLLGAHVQHARRARAAQPARLHGIP